MSVAFAHLPGLGEDEYPGFPADECPEEPPDLRGHHSVTADILRSDPGLYPLLRQRQTSLGVGLAKCIKTGMDNRGHPMIKTLGAVAGDAECYEVFKPLFDRLVQQRHGEACLARPHAEASPRSFGQPAGELCTTPADPYGDYVLSAQVRAARNLAGVRFPPAVSKGERREVERVLVRGLLELDGELKGEYFPLSGSQSYALKPGGMSQAEEEELSRNGMLFTYPDSTATLCTGSGRHWPDARGIFANSSCTLSVWLNEEEHLRAVVVRNGGDLQAAFRELAGALAGVEASMLRHADGPAGFAWSDRLGYLTSSPGNLGTALRVSAIVRLPLLAQQEALNTWCTRRRLVVRPAVDEGGVKMKGVLEVSNKERLGISEVDTVNLVVEAVALMVQAERHLEEGVTSALLRDSPPVSVIEADAPEASPAAEEVRDAVDGGEAWGFAGEALSCLFTAALHDDEPEAAEAQAVAPEAARSPTRSPTPGEMEKLRTRLAETLLASLGSGHLHEALEAQQLTDASNEMLETVKSKVAELLLQGHASGALAAALQDPALTAPAPAVPEEPSMLEQVKCRVADLLYSAAKNGVLASALQAIPSYASQEEDSSAVVAALAAEAERERLEGIRSRMLSALESSAEDGTLRHLLGEGLSGAEPPPTAEVGTPPVALDVETVRQQVKQSFEEKLKSGELEAYLSSEPGIFGTRAEDNDRELDGVREQVRLGFEDKLKAGALEEFLKGVTFSKAPATSSATPAAIQAVLLAMRDCDIRIGRVSAAIRDTERRLAQQEAAASQLEADLAATQQEAALLDEAIEQKRRLLDEAEAVECQLQERERQLYEEIDAEMLRQRHAAVDMDQDVLYNTRSELSTACTMRDLSPRTFFGCRALMDLPPPDPKMATGDRLGVQGSVSSKLPPLCLAGAAVR